MKTFDQIIAAIAGVANPAEDPIRGNLLRAYRGAGRGRDEGSREKREQQRDRFYDLCERFLYREPPPIVLPLAAYYRGEPEHEKARASFYADCARVFGFEGWSMDRSEYQAPTGKTARDKLDVERYGDGARDLKRNNTSDAMTWLINAGHMNSRIEGLRTDQKLEIAWSEGRTRIITADAIAIIFEKAEITPLRSPDPEAIGGGGFGPRKISIATIVAQMERGDLRADMPPALMSLLERIILANEFAWEYAKTKSDRESVFQSIRLALDFADWSMARRESVVSGEKARAELVERWPVAGEWFRTRKLRLATHQARAIAKPSRRA